MTFVRSILGALAMKFSYLSDRLPFRDLERAPSLRNDYGLLDDFPNPAQELYQNNPDNIMENLWFIPEELSPLINESMEKTPLDIG